MFQSLTERNWSVFALIVGALIIAYVLGYAIAFQETSGYWISLGIGGVLLLLATLFAPIEVMILAGMLGTMLADSRIVPGGLVYYARFVPMGMLTIRTVAEFLVKRNPRLPITRSFVFPTLPILFLAFVSAIYGIDPERIFQRAISMLFVVVSFGIGLPSFWQTRAQTEQGLKWVASLLIVVLTIGFVLFDLNPQYTFYEYAYIRLHGIFSGPNTQGLMAMMAIFPVAWWWHTARRPLPKLILALAVLLVIGELIAAGSRASFLGAVVGALTVVWLGGQFSVRNLILFSLGGLALMVIVLFEPTLARVLQFSSDSDRVFLWQRSVELGMNSPIWGVGLGASDLIYAADKPYLLSIGKATGGSHSSYFRMFVDLGIIGVAIGFLVFIVVLVKAFSAPKPIRRDAMVVFLAATVIAGLVNAGFEDWLFGFGSASTPILWFALALLAFRIEMLAQEQSSPAPAPSPTPIQLRRIQL